MNPLPPCWKMNIFPIAYVSPSKDQVVSAFVPVLAEKEIALKLSDNNPRLTPPDSLPLKIPKEIQGKVQASYLSHLGGSLDAYLYLLASHAEVSERVQLEPHAKEISAETPTRKEISRAKLPGTYSLQMWHYQEKGGERLAIFSGKPSQEKSFPWVVFAKEAGSRYYKLDPASSLHLSDIATLLHALISQLEHEPETNFFDAMGEPEGKVRLKRFLESGHLEGCTLLCELTEEQLVVYASSAASLKEELLRLNLRFQRQ